MPLWITKGLTHISFDVSYAFLIEFSLNVFQSVVAENEYSLEKYFKKHTQRFLFSRLRSSFGEYNVPKSSFWSHNLVNIAHTHQACIL